MTHNRKGKQKKISPRTRKRLDRDTGGQMLLLTGIMMAFTLLIVATMTLETSNLDRLYSDSDVELTRNFNQYNRTVLESLDHTISEKFDELGNITLAVEDAISETQKNLGSFF